MNKPELLIPADNLEKLRTALLLRADNGKENNLKNINGSNRYF